MVVMEGGRGLMESGRGWYEGQELQGLNHASSSPHPGLNQQTDSPHTHQHLQVNMEERKCSRKELSLCHKFKFSNPHISATCWCKSLKFQTVNI